MQLNNVITDWLNRRKISDQVIADFGISMSDHGGIVIPIRDIDGVHLFNKYRRNPLSDEGPKYIYEKGGTVQLFGLDKALSAKTVLICEGEMDALVAWSYNIPAVSSTGGAQSFQQGWVEYFAGKEVIFCFDNDHAGGEGMAKALDIIPWAKVLFLPDRPGIKDISDYVMNGGDLHDLIKSAISFSGMESVIQNRSDRIALWQSVFFHDAYIKNHTEKPVARRIGPQVGSEDARNYPIDRLVEFGSNNKAKCLWHNEKTESMHYFADTNKVYCFGCGKSADAIDVYRKIHGCSFLEAVKSLSK